MGMGWVTGFSCFDEHCQDDVCSFLQLRNCGGCLQNSFLYVIGCGFRRLDRCKRFVSWLLAVFACSVVSRGLLLGYWLHVVLFFCFCGDRTIANFFGPCWPDYRRFFAAVCANFQIQILNLKLKIRGAGEGDGDGDGRWGWGWGWDG